MPKQHYTKHEEIFNGKLHFLYSVRVFSDQYFVIKGHSLSKANRIDPY